MGIRLAALYVTPFLPLSCLKLLKGRDCACQVDRNIRIGERGVLVSNREVDNAGRIVSDMVCKTTGSAAARCCCVGVVLGCKAEREETELWN